jgi:hypothetical protein
MQSSLDPFAIQSSRCARATLALVLIAGATASLAITSVIHSHQSATAQHAERQIVPAPRAALSIPLDSGEVGPFAFGHVVFDWDPSAAGGVPGFDSWPPGSRR